jgi:hypothetical protein
VQSTTLPDQLTDNVSRVLLEFSRWLSDYGESSLDYQTFYAGRVGGLAKTLYYRNRRLGILAVAPMVFCEAFIPSARHLFYHRVRFPIADAHFAMGFGFLYRATSDPYWFQQAKHFLRSLEETRCAGFDSYCWGYPFDWVTINGLMKKQTPLITTTPYVYEAFLQLYQLEPEEKWKRILESIARHAATDIKDFPVNETASACSYNPYDKGGVINAAAYRSFLLTSASKLLSNDSYGEIAKRNLNFVLMNQNPNGSWYYAVDGVRDFVDHYHTCFVLKALAKVHSLTADKGCLEAISKGVQYYLANLFAEDGLPRPFSKAPRLTVYKRELYDIAECINLCLLLRDRFPQLNDTLNTVVGGFLKEWVRPDGSFRSRRLYFGWDNVPMHRWGQSQMFRSLAYFLAENERRSSRENVLTGKLRPELAVSREATANSLPVG